MEKHMSYMGNMIFSAVYCGKPISYSADSVREAEEHLCIGESGCTIYLEKQMLRRPVILHGERAIHMRL